MTADAAPGATPSTDQTVTTGGTPATPAPAPNPAAGPAVSPAAVPPSPAAATGPAPAAPVAPTVSPELAEARQQLAEAQAQIQRYLPLAQMGYRQYQTQQQPPAPPTQPAKKSPFGVPEFDHGLLKFLSKDASGRVVADPAAPPDAVARYQAYADAVQQAQQGFWTDPMRALGDPIRELVREEAQKLVQQQYQQAQSQTQVQQILGQHADWIFEKTADGQVRHQVDPLTGRADRVLTPMGRAYAQMVQRAESMGIRDVTGQHDYAVAMLQNAVWQSQQRQQQLPAAGDAAKANFLAQAQAAPPAAVAPQPPVTTPPAPETISLRQRMARNLQQAGVTDDVIRTQNAGAA